MHFESFADLIICAKGHLCHKLSGELPLNSRKLVHLEVQMGRGRKPVCSDVIEVVASAIIKQSVDTFVGCNSACAVSQHLGVSYSTVWNVVSKMLHYFMYTVSHNQQLLALDREK